MMSLLMVQPVVLNKLHKKTAPAIARAVSVILSR